MGSGSYTARGDALRAAGPEAVIDFAYEEWRVEKR